MEICCAKVLHHPAAPVPFDIEGFKVGGWSWLIRAGVVLCAAVRPMHGSDLHKTIVYLQVRVYDYWKCMLTLCHESSMYLMRSSFCCEPVEDDETTGKWWCVCCCCRSRSRFWPIIDWWTDWPPWACGWWCGCCWWWWDDGWRFDMFVIIGWLFLKITTHTDDQDHIALIMDQKVNRNQCTWGHLLREPTITIKQHSPHVTIHVTASNLAEKKRWNVLNDQLNAASA